jgi:anti-sigma regulatory factor (Ser/Thr protein kinase)
MQLSPCLGAVLQIALDEVLSNILRHAYTDTARHTIELRMAVGPAQVVLEVIDDGAPFDPTAIPPSRPRTIGAQPQVGGLGLVFIKRLMDEVAFVRRDGRNHLTLRKRVPPP